MDANLFEQVREVAKLPDLGVDARVLGVRRGNDAVELARGEAVAGREQRHVDPRATSASVSRLVTSSHGP